MLKPWRISFRLCMTASCRSLVRRYLTTGSHWRFVFPTPAAPTSCTGGAGWLPSAMHPTHHSKRCICCRSCLVRAVAIRLASLAFVGRASIVLGKPPWCHFSYCRPMLASRPASGQPFVCWEPERHGQKGPSADRSVTPAARRHLPEHSSHPSEAGALHGVGARPIQAWSHVSPT